MALKQAEWMKAIKPIGDAMSCDIWRFIRIVLDP